MKISSRAFAEGSKIPDKYSCSGDNINPPLRFETVPEDAKSLALILEDPDAPSGNYVHWVVFNILPATSEIAEGSALLPGVQAKNSSGRATYVGPCPPSGTHRYYFRLYALDTVFDSESIRNQAALVDAMQGHILAEAELMAKYTKHD